MKFRKLVEMVDDLQDMIIDEEFGPDLAAKVIIKLGELKSYLSLPNILIDECEKKNNSEFVDEDIYDPVFDEILWKIVYIL